MASWSSHAATVTTTETRPVVVELFTSQGCLSCPPADRLLARLGAESTHIVALAFHVDYWNYIGWRDPFSSAAWSRRQEAYARRLGLNPYTPQAVVAGRIDVLGSNERALRAAVAAAAAAPAARLWITLDDVATPGRVRIGVELPEPLRGRRLDLMLATYENGLATPVARGENGGRTLRNDYVVRSLARVARFEGRNAPATEVVGEIRREPGPAGGISGLAVFLQDPETLEIVGAASAPLSAPGAPPASGP